MKTKKNLIKICLLAGLGLILAGRTPAQTFTNLHSFSATFSPNFTNSDGASPLGSLVFAGNTLYGTAPYGGTNGNGTIFAVNTNGTGFTNLHSFTAISGTHYTNSDGYNPQAGLILSGNTLYGTAQDGGTIGFGTVFKLNLDGTGFTNLHSFTAISGTLNTNSEGVSPRGLVLSGNTLYGTAVAGGTNGNGTVFKLNTNGTGFTTLHSFAATSGPFPYTNSDGSWPNAVILSGNTLYGTAINGGRSGAGAVFALNTDGTGFTNLHSFTATDPTYFTNRDGANPQAGLILSGNTLYGTAVGGGSSGNGIVFAVNTNGMGFTNLYSFRAGGYDASSNYTNSDGANPQTSLILSGNTLYGTAYDGGGAGNGTVFAVNTNGTGFTCLYSFTAASAAFPYNNSDGGAPNASLILSGNTLFGTAVAGGSADNGTVFSLSLPPPPLTITPSGANVILTWPTYAPGITLQSTTNLVSTAVWSTVSPVPVVVTGQNAVTNPISGTRKFYRLSQ